MARSVFGVSTSPQASTAPSPTAATSPVRGKLAGAALEAYLRRPRSPEYLAALGRLDAGSHGLDPAERAVTAAIVRAEFPELQVEQLPQGFVAKCYLGEPFEIHTFDLHTGDVICHYRVGETMPGGLERGRALALHGAYPLVEVYGTEVRGIHPTGRPTGPATR